MRPAVAPPNPVLNHEPATFLERGTAMPYTTPHLAGARLRPGRRGGYELVVPNIAGGKGTYILSLDAIPTLCAPTLHDRAVNAMLAELPAITPSAIRQVARMVAERGLAGRAAAHQAAAAAADEHKALARARFELAMELLRQVEPRRDGWIAPEHSSPDALRERIGDALDRLAAQLGQPAEALPDALEALAALFAGVGTGPQAGTARLPALLARIAALQGQMRALQRDAPPPGSPEAALVEASAALTVAAGRTTLLQARALLADMPGLIRRWLGERDAVAAIAARPDWLLDGWQRICLLWRAAADDRVGRAATLAEMAMLLPTLPREASEWVPGMRPAGSAGHRRQQRTVVLGEDWRTGITVTDLVARNERLRVWSPDGPA